jgi:uncharacterized protein YbjT (DUF2867 family)
MRITVFGASGGIGGHFIDLAAERGHSIRAVYRTAPPVPPGGQVEVLVNPDVFDPDFVATSSLGPSRMSTSWSRPSGPTSPGATTPGPG